MERAEVNHAEPLCFLSLLGRAQLACGFFIAGFLGSEVFGSISGLCPPDARTALLLPGCDTLCHRAWPVCPLGTVTPRRTLLRTGVHLSALSHLFI